MRICLAHKGPPHPVLALLTNLACFFFHSANCIKHFTLSHLILKCSQEWLPQELTARKQRFLRKSASCQNLSLQLGLLLGQSKCFVWLNLNVLRWVLQSAIHPRFHITLNENCLLWLRVLGFCFRPLTLSAYVTLSTAFLKFWISAYKIHT